MIVSHRHRFIFIKSAKTASTSVELMLSKICGPDDILTPLAPFDERFDADYYEYQPRNCEGFQNHMSAIAIKNKVGEEVWNQYLKITIVRNPWDMVVSRYYWEKARLWPSIGKNVANILREPFAIVRYKRLLHRIKLIFVLSSFSNFIRYFDKTWTNSRFYFDEEGKPICDVYLRFQNLNKGINDLEKMLGIQLGDLPRLKSKPRKDKKHYSQHFNQQQKERVEKLFKHEIEVFGYTFEQVNQ
ncbi:MAG: sulfotransferase family 2 domain-containing protein [Tenuifilum sp.]|uniref:sulfotransferase family 2 domain-containing protein n=1 Tax=Tenuifilum sp. TaxID=2760880 RepID=UPI003098F1C5